MLDLKVMLTVLSFKSLNKGLYFSGLKQEVNRVLNALAMFIWDVMVAP
jgi:hypothetical protein